MLFTLFIYLCCDDAQFRGAVAVYRMQGNKRIIQYKKEIPFWVTQAVRKQANGRR